jgi:hypothetical protein
VTADRPALEARIADLEQVTGYASRALDQILETIADILADTRAAREELGGFRAELLERVPGELDQIDAQLGRNGALLDQIDGQLGRNGALLEEILRRLP